VKEGSFKIHNAGKLHPGDGIAFFDKTGTLTGSLVNGVKDGRVRADNLKGLENGGSVFRNLDREFIKSVERDGALRKFAVKMEFSETEKGFALKASDERGAAVTKELPHKKEAAKKPGQALDTIKKQLSKLGETVFYLESLDVKLSEPFFIPVSVLNDLRRDALAALENAGAAAPAREERKLSPNDFPYPETKLDYTANVLNSRAASFYKRHGVTEVGRAAEAGADLTGRPLMVARFCLRRRLGLCKKGRAVEPLYLEDAEGSRFRLEFDCAACRMRLFRDSAAPAAGTAAEPGGPEEPEE